jgi:hypothetical protein
MRETGAAQPETAAKGPRRDKLYIFAGRSGRAARLPATCSARTAARRAPCIASRYGRQNAQLIPARTLTCCDNLDLDEPSWIGKACDLERRAHGVAVASGSKEGFASAIESVEIHFS